MKTLITLFVISFAFSLTVAQDLVTDGGFEANNTFPQNWTWVWAQDQGGTATQSNEQARTGSFSCKIVVDGQFYWGADYTGIQQRLNPQTNTEYILRFYFKGQIPPATDGEVEAEPTSGGDNVALGVDSKNNVPLIRPNQGEFIIESGNYSDWTRVDYYWNSGSGYTDYTIDIGTYTDGNEVYYMDDFQCLPSSATSVGNNSIGPYEFKVFQNYPNPFNPSTVIRFSIPERDNVVINVYNEIGEIVNRILSYNMPAGYHEVEFDARDLSSGVYFVRVETSNNVDVKKMLLMK
jgi:hypothetical protein